MTQAIKDIMDHMLFQEETSQAFSALYNESLTKNQQQSLSFYIARRIALQLLTGSYMFDGDHPDHRFSSHQEQCMSITYEGSKPGDFLVDEQVFGANVGDPEDARDHVITQVALMDRFNGHAPYILFCSASAGEKIDPKVLERTRGRLKEGIYTDIVQDPEIFKLIMEGKILIVPTAVVDQTRKIVDIPNFVA